MGCPTVVLYLQADAVTLQRIQRDCRYHQHIVENKVGPGTPCGHLHALSIGAQTWTRPPWLRLAEKRGEVAYLCSPTRHIMFQRTPLPLSRFFPSLNLFFDTQRRITTGVRTVREYAWKMADLAGCRKPSAASPASHGPLRSRKTSAVWQL